MAGEEFHAPEYYLRLAIEQNAEMNLFFLLDHCQLSTVRAMCVMIKSGHFVARAPLAALERSPIVWGSDVAGYFSVREHDVIHCNFKTRLARLYNGPASTMYMIFPLPRFMDHEQRRFSRRVEIPGEGGENLKVWHGSLEGLDDENLPKFRWRPLENYECVLAEISASGMRLDVNKNAGLSERLNINDTVLLAGDFGTSARSAELFVLGNIVRRMPRPDNEDIISFGCHFNAWRPAEARTSQDWFRIDPQEGLGRIAQWLARKFHTVSI